VSGAGGFLVGIADLRHAVEGVENLRARGLRIEFPREARLVRAFGIDGDLPEALLGFDGKIDLPQGREGSTTRLWRAVEADELADVVKYGDYNIHPNSTFKRFGFDEGSLDDFIKANPARDYTKTYIDVPTKNLDQMFRHPDPGGVGKAIGIDVYENPTFYDWFDNATILPK